MNCILQILGTLTVSWFSASGPENTFTKHNYFSSIDLANSKRGFCLTVNGGNTSKLITFKNSAEAMLLNYPQLSDRNSVFYNFCLKRNCPCRSPLVFQFALFWCLTASFNGIFHVWCALDSDLPSCVGILTERGNNRAWGRNRMTVNGTYGLPDEWILRKCIKIELRMMLGEHTGIIFWKRGTKSRLFRKLITYELEYCCLRCQWFTKVTCKCNMIFQCYTAGKSSSLIQNELCQAQPPTRGMIWLWNLLSCKPKNRIVEQV